MGGKRKRQARDAPSMAPTAKKHRETQISPKKNPPVVAVDSTPFLEEPKGSELKREVQLYEQLGSQDESKRLEAADAVVSALLGDDGVSEGILQRHLTRRLFRGLASGRKGARLGFSVVLTEILAQICGSKQPSNTKYPGLTFEKVLAILKEKTKPEGDLSGQEEKDHALGRLFGLQCFVRAMILFDSDQDRWEKVLECLLKLAKKKPWMREECGWVIIEALRQMNQPQVEETLQKIHEAGLAASSEGVGLWLEARRRFPGMKFPIKPWGHNGNPLDHLNALARALKESSSPSSGDKTELAQVKGSWNPQLHFAWGIVLDTYIENVRQGKEGAVPEFENFWKVAVDENLFSSSASPERKFWGFLLFQKMLSAAKSYSHMLGTVFSHNLMRCLINHACEEDRFLHRAAEKSLKLIKQTVEAEPSTVGVILSKLISANGVYNFDQVTKTKTVEKILSYINDENASSIINETLFFPIKEIKTGDSERDAEARRQLYGDYLLSMIRHFNIIGQPEDISWIQNVGLPSMAALAYTQDEAFQPPISEKSRNIFRSRLASAFAHLISLTNGFSLPCNLLQTFQPTAVDMDEEIASTSDAALATMQRLIKRAKNAADSEKKPLQALTTLYALVIFQLYNGEPEAVSLLEELKLCYDTLIRKKSPEDIAVEPSVVLVEILLSFLSKPSVLLRKIAQHVFTAFAGEISRAGLKILLGVLESSEGLRGQQELFDQENESGGEGEEEENDNDDNDDEANDTDELDSDVEMIEVNGSHERDESADSRNGKDDDGDYDEDEEARKLDDALAAALGTHRGDQDLNEASSDSDADMSDSEMMELDSKLVEIFSQRKKLPNKKQERKDARENIINFKTRVLDLLEIFVKEQSASPLAFDLLVPLLKLMRTTTAKHLSERAHKVVATFAKASKALKKNDNDNGRDRDHDHDRNGDSEAPTQAPDRLSILRSLHEEASRDPSHAFARAASTASLLVASSLYRLDREHVAQIADVYRDSQIRWLQGQWRMQAVFFHDWVNWCQSHVSSS